MWELWRQQEARVKQQVTRAQYFTSEIGTCHKCTLRTPEISETSIVVALSWIYIDKFTTLKFTTLVTARLDKYPLPVPYPTHSLSL